MSKKDCKEKKVQEKPKVVKKECKRGGKVPNIVKKEIKEVKKTSITSKPPILEKKVKKEVKNQRGAKILKDFLYLHSFRNCTSRESPAYDI